MAARPGGAAGSHGPDRSVFALSLQILDDKFFQRSETYEQGAHEAYDDPEIQAKGRIEAAAYLRWR